MFLGVLEVEEPHKVSSAISTSTKKKKASVKGKSLL